MKKSIFGFIIIAMIILGGSLYASADIYVGDLYRTDTFAYIDMQGIPVYSFNNLPYVVAEDLNGYGFDVKWDGKNEILSLTYNKNKKYFPYDNSDIRYSSFKTKVKNVYKNDTRVTINETKVESYSIDGRMIIKLDDLWRIGEVNWYDESGAISVTTKNFMKNNPDWKTLLKAYFLADRLVEVYSSAKNYLYELIDVDSDTFYYYSDYAELLDYNMQRANKCFDYIKNDKYLYEKGNLYHLAYNTVDEIANIKKLCEYMDGKKFQRIITDDKVDNRVYYINAAYEECEDRYDSVYKNIFKFIDFNYIKSNNLPKYSF